MNNLDDVDGQGRFWRIPKWFPNLSHQAQTQLRAFHSELLYFNGRMNLISPRSEKSADLIHISDGILGSQAVFGQTESKEIFDIGSGNGIPGIIMALLDPSRQIVLVDADARKIEFMKHCIARLGLTNCTTLHARLEELGESSIHCAVSRGFASLSKSLLLVRRAASPDCEFFHFKGPAWSTEVAEIPSQILASWEPVHVTDYDLPTGEHTMSIVLTKRIIRSK